MPILRYRYRCRCKGRGRDRDRDELGYTYFISNIHKQHSVAKINESFLYPLTKTLPLLYTTDSSQSVN